MKLTWNQRRALKLTAERGLGAGVTPREITENPHWTFGPKYLCGSAARTALMSLQRKGLVECIPTSPLRYKITDAGLAALEEGE